MASSRNKQRTYARNRYISRTGRLKFEDSDSQYFLRLVLIVLLGTFWLKFAQPLQVGMFVIGGIPVGMLFGLLLISRFEKSPYNRKIWYAILLVVTIICFFVPAGVVI